MASKFRNVVAGKCLNTIKTLNIDFEASNRAIASQLKLNLEKNSRVCLKLDPEVFKIQNQISKSNLVKVFPLDNDGIIGVDGTDDRIIKFHLCRQKFINNVLKTTFSRPAAYKWSRNALFPPEVKKVVVEFSSPNIAKPFHVGHFRSTIVGNFVANINSAVGNQVIKINYLGDWGTQFGLLIAGLESTGTEVEEIAKDPIKTLLDVYVRANSLADQNPEFAMKARNAFNSLENGDEEKLEIWKTCRELTIKELNKNYTKLNVSFDHYHGESMYSLDKSDKIMHELKEHGLLRTLEDGRTVIDLDDKHRVTLIKSDGSSLYITRDIAAAVHRREEFLFDELIYVVDNAQGNHFSNLFRILQMLGHDWSGHCRHVRFGKILGISTRKGNMVYISDLLEEATNIMLENQEKSKNTRIFTENEKRENAELVGISALIVNDLKQRISKDYKFSWSRALSHAGDTGVKLQYTHARLSSLIDTCAVTVDIVEINDIDTNSLEEVIALELAYTIAKFDEILSISYRTCEPHHLVQYLFTLCNTVSKALNVLQVKTAPDINTARARLLMFQCAKKTLGEGLTLLGIKPLDRM